MKRILALATVLCIVSTLFLVADAEGTEVIGRITSDATWTKSQSPITLTGAVNVNEGVTLTVEAGVTVNLNGYYIQVEGTLHSVGTSSEQIQISHGKITFKENSNGWNPQTGTGNIIENSKLNGVAVLAYSTPALKFNQNNLDGELSVSGTSIVTSNTVVGKISVDGASIVWKNTVNGTISTSGYEATKQKHPIISCNTVKGNIGTVGIFAISYVLIQDNTIFGFSRGIGIGTGRDVMGGCIPANAVLERNRITGCTEGIYAELYNAMASASGYCTAKSNTLSSNNIGVCVDGWSQCLLLENNNIEDCSEYSYYLKSGGDVDVSGNWWGTTDTNAIRQSIYDSNQDFNLGTVTFEPVLAAENSAAYPNQNAPMPTPQTSSTPSATVQPTHQTTPTSTDNPTTSPTLASTNIEQPTFSFDLEVATFAALIVVIALLTVLIALVLRKRNPKLPPPPPPS